MTKIQQGLLIGTIAIVLAAFLWFFNTRSALAPSSTPAATTTPQGVTVAGTGEFTISEEDASVQDLPQPDYNTPIAFALGVSTEVRAVVEADLVQKRAALKSNPEDFNAWIVLGALYHMGGDEKMAEKIWLYTSALAPTSPLPYYNLADLYLDFLKDYVKAEAMYKKALALDPRNPAPYRNLFSLYTDYGYKKGTSAAEDILKQGIAAVANTVYDLHILLARYYKVQGRTAEAKAEFDLAIAAAEVAGRSDVAEQLREEKAAL